MSSDKFTIVCPYCKQIVPNKHECPKFKSLRDFFKKEAKRERKAKRKKEDQDIVIETEEEIKNWMSI